MMSYLWILLLGSLLAAGAKAQDDAVDPGTPAPEADTAEANEDPAAAEETPTAEEISPTESAPEPTAEPEAEADDAVTPAKGDAEPAAPAEDAAEPEAPTEGDAEPAGSTEGDAEAATPAAEEVDAVTPGDSAAEAATPAAAAGSEEEAAATTAAPEPAAKPDDTEEQPTATGEEENTSSQDAASAQEEDDQATQVTDTAAGEKEEEPTNPAAAAEPTVKVVPEVPIPKENANEVETDSFNLEDALSDNTVDNQGKPETRGSSESGAHAAGARDDKPEAQEASSGSLAAVLSTIGVAVVGAVTGYFTYQKKKLCFKNRQEADPEAARKADAAEAQSDPQVLSNLLNSS